MQVCTPEVKDVNSTVNFVIYTFIVVKDQGRAYLHIGYCEHNVFFYTKSINGNTIVTMVPYQIIYKTKNNKWTPKHLEPFYKGLNFVHKKTYFIFMLKNLLKFNFKNLSL